MVLYLCSDCLGSAGPQSAGTDTQIPLSGVPPFSRRVSSLRALLSGLLGGLIGMLAGNPVAVLVGATLGVVASAVNPRDPDVEHYASGLTRGTCAACGSAEGLEACSNCGRLVCPLHRRLVMGQEEHEGRTLYRHYVPEQDDEDASFSLFQPMVSGQADAEPPRAGYRLGDDLYELDEISGELIPVDSLIGSSEEVGSDPTQGWGCENASSYAGEIDWAGADSWGASAWPLSDGDSEPNAEDGSCGEEEGGGA